MVVLGALGTAVGVIAFLGAVAVFLRGSADKGTIESLQRSNLALTQELGITNTKCETLDARVQALENENQVLRAAVSHTEEIRRLQTTVDEILTLVMEKA